MRRATIGYSKLVFLYLVYWLVGLDEEEFYVMKGNYLFDGELYAAAAKAYQRALRDTQSPYVTASLGYCYLNLGLHAKAVEHLRRAYSRRTTPEFGTALARALFEAGDLEESRHLHAVLIQSADSYSAELREELMGLGVALAEPPAHVDETPKEARVDA